LPILNTAFASGVSLSERIHHQTPPWRGFLWLPASRQEKSLDWPRLLVSSLQSSLMLAEAAWLIEVINSASDSPADHDLDRAEEVFTR